MARTPSLEARQKVLVAAQEVVRDAGIDGFTVDEVAHRSGVAKTTIYRHFHNAHHLVVAALDCMITPMATMPMMTWMACNPVIAKYRL